MTKMIQVRNVPDAIHQELKARATRAGMSLSDFLAHEMERIVATPPVDEILERIVTKNRPALSETPAEALRSERDSR
ncbi:MAG: hypothetical protein WD990_09590 [Acidimicrobiia bacterium]